MNKPVNLKQASQGFTIIEMLIATTVFSVVLLACSMGLLQVSRTFYKGITITKTQEVARAVIDDIASSAQFTDTSGASTLAVNSGSSGVCIGNTRYSYVIGRMLTEDGSPHAFVVDHPGGANCSGSARDLSAQLTGDARELLAPRTRLSSLNISSAGTLTTISVRIAAGEDDLLSNPMLPTAKCKSVFAGGQYCTVVDLTTTVQKRVQ